ncbi:ribosome biogenesis protein SPATA5L1 isoform X2 [Wyeomyia smithii]|uniref:ribosome biogenesis protein SPATA5L1 isoform X2 n=1 Tax=Wyeomyia smithii TaxID=174621 RepID=UPI002467FE85|nr:ribosome biogenesis protein SPATA5L1 isoform X2 [Wyeomyia smithii]
MLITINLPITSDSGQIFHAAQICEIASHCIAESNEGKRLRPGASVVCRIFGSNRQFLCKWFAPSGERLRRKDPVCYVDQCVELLNDNVSAEHGIPLVQDLLMITEDLCCFQKITIEVKVDCMRLNLDLVKDREQLVALLKDILQTFYFSKGCLIRFNDQLAWNYGIISVTVDDTLGLGKYGQTNQETVVELSNITFNSEFSKTLGGLSVTKNDIRAILNRTTRENILLTGPAGSGKTSLVKQLAQEQNSPVFYVRGLDFIKSLPGETELELKNIFERVQRFGKAFAPTVKSILLVKDVESLCSKLSSRKGEDLSNISRISCQFIALLDRYQLDGNFVTIASTSQIEALDLRVRRPGRLGAEIFIRMPSEQQRIEIVKTVLEHCNFHLDSSSLDDIVARTSGYVGADLELLINSISRSISGNPSKSVQSCIDESLRKIRPNALRDSIGLISGLSETLDVIGGMDQLKKSLRTSVLGPLRHRQAFRRFGMRPLKGILLYGPPGCAKTTIARCLAAESRMTFVSVSAAEVYSPYVGDAEKLIARLFNQARLSAPAVIFLDEIDSLVGNRSTQGIRANDVHVRVLSTLLTEMDGIGSSVQSAVGSREDSKNILVIAATNRPDMIDDALLRPGRLTKLIHVPAPDELGRLAILKKVSEKIPLAEDVCLEELAKQTERYSGADLQNLCSQAALHGAALDENIQQVTMDHFQHVMQESRPSLTREQIEWYFRYETKHKII